MKRKLLLLSVLLLLIVFNSSAAVITAKVEAGVVFKVWGQASSWNLNRVPRADDDVLIPATAEILIGGGTPNITVNSIKVEGNLTVNSSIASLNLRTKYMMIMGASAAFIWGTEQNPFNGKGTLTLLGLNSAEVIPGTSAFSKGIMVMEGGLLEIHGKYQTSWTQLGITANENPSLLAKSLTLAADLPVVGWGIGDSIVVASTDYDNNHAERYAITGIDLPNKRVTINQPIRWKHFGQKLSYQNSVKQFDQRAEVGLITRNITIQGELTSGAALGYGGYIMCMSMSNTRLSNVNLLNMGQNGNKGSYPMHWHLTGETSNNFIKNSVIRNSFNRGIVLHSTDNVEVDSNVLYQHRGHGYMLEDGDEENNFFRNNLGLGTLAPRNSGLAVEASEMEPATYWITNPNNTFNGNVAAGSINTGFWIIPVSGVLRDTELRKAPNYSPRAFKLKSFVNNVGHSCRKQNLALEGNMTFSVVNGKVVKSEALFDPRYPEFDVLNDPLKHVFTNFTSYKGAQNGVWTRAGVTNEFIGCYFGEASFMAFLSYNAMVTNSVFHALSGNTGSGTPLDKPNQDDILGFQMYNGSTDITNVHFAGFGDTTKAICIGNRQSSGKFPNFKATGLTFETDGTFGSLKRVDFGYKSLTEDPAKSTLFVAGLIDVDGSISGINGGRITPRIYNTKSNKDAYDNRIFDSNFNIPKLTGNRTYFPKWNAYVTTNTRYGILHNFMGWGENSGTAEDRFIYAIRSDGPATFDQLRLGHDSQLPIILEEKNSPGGAIREDIIYATQFHETPNRILSEFKWTTNGANTIAAFLNVPSDTRLYIGTKTSAQPLSVLDVMGNEVGSLADLKGQPNRGYAIVDNTLYIKYVATDPDADTNTSGVSIDYSSPDIHIDLNPGGTNTGLQNFVTLADFNSNAVDARGSLAKFGANINFNPITATANTNNFTLIKGATPSDDYVDYNFELVSKQVWKEFKKITINFQGPPAVLMLRDNLNSGNWVTVRTIPNTPTLNQYDIPLTDLNVTDLDSVKQLKLRFYQSAMPTNQNTFNVVLDRMALSLEDLLVNPISSTSIQETLSITTDLNEIKIYPNPANGMVTIGLGNIITDLSIYDLTGRVVYAKKSVQGDLVIPTSQIGKAGTYIVKTNNMTKTMIVID